MTPSPSSPRRWQACHRELPLDGPLPFLGRERRAFHLAVENKDGAPCGVECYHEPDRPSPHLVRTHVESSRHVWRMPPPPIAWPWERELSAVLLSLESRRERATPGPGPVGWQRTWHFGEEPYPVGADVELAAEPVVTAEALARQTQDIPEGPVDVVLIRFEGMEEALEAWPFLTLTATAALMERWQPRGIIINVPSLDRHPDGGAVPNHRQFLTRSERFVGELADFRGLTPGPCVVRMRPIAPAEDAIGIELAVAKI